MITLPGRQKLPETRLRYLWDKYKFHLSALILIVPGVYLAGHLTTDTVPRRPTVNGSQIFIGTFTLVFGESNSAPPEEIIGGWMKSYDVQLCKDCFDRIKGMYLRVGKPRSLRAAGVLFGGNPFRLSAALQMPPSTNADSELWITIETWDGEVSHASVPLRAISPTTVDFFEQQQKEQGSAE